MDTLGDGGSATLDDGKSSTLGPDNSDACGARGCSGEGREGVGVVAEWVAERLNCGLIVEKVVK